jgi:hypothetical protein
MSAFGAWLSRAPPPESRKGVGVTLKILETVLFLPKSPCFRAKGRVGMAGKAGGGVRRQASCMEGRDFFPQGGSVRLSGVV